MIADAASGARRSLVISVLFIPAGVAQAGVVQAGAAKAEDAREIVTRSVNADNRNERLRRNYTYKVLNETRELDSSGNVTAAHRKLEEVLYIGGRTYLRTLEQDGKPLGSKDEAREQAKLDRAAHDASRLSQTEKLARENQEQRERARRRERLQYVPDAFSLRIAAEVNINGRDAWQIEARPRLDYKGPYASLLRNMEGTLWIDKTDYQWVKVEADTLNTISLGLFLARIGKGTRISFENTRVNNEIWAPKRVTLKASARLALLRKLNAEQEVTFSEYRKFQSDSRLVPAAEAVN
jgi:hypothetical protein